MSDWTNLPFEEALNYLRGLRPMTREAFDTLMAEARAQAFTVARVTKLETLQELLDELTRIAEEGGSLADFVAKADEVTALSDFHLETVFRTNLQSAYGAGRWEQGTDPDIAENIWGWEYHTVGDDRVREEHEALDGMRFAVGEGDSVFPPWDYNCRCSAEWITTTEAEEKKFRSDQLPPDAVEALGESDFASPALRAGYRPDLSSFSPGLVNHFVRDQEGFS